jgi:hypothetical protein
MDVFAQQVVMMRQWMKDHGHQNKPLINTEFAVLYPFDDFDDPENPTTCFLQDEFGGCFTPQRVINFMQEAVQYQDETTSVELGYPLDNYRLVQQWLWYAMNDGAEGTPNALVNNDTNPTALTTIGDAYKQEIANRTRQVNLLGAAASTTAVHDTTTAEIWASIRNNGNVPTGAPFEVTFYEDASLTKIIDTVTVPPSLGGCARHETKVSVTWSGLQPIVNQFWAVIESVEDPDQTDNTVTGFVFVDPEQTFVPVISR